MGYREMWPGHACCTHLSSVASPPRSIIGFALVIVVGLTGISVAAPPSYTVVDLGTLEEGNSIVVRGLNNNGDIASGYCSSSSNCEVASFGSLHGFVLSAGKFVSLDVPGAAGTLAFGINDRGLIVGAYTDTNLRVHGFVRTP